MPLLVSRRVEVIDEEVLDHLLGVPATTFERPRGTSMKGSLSVCWLAWPGTGVATMTPRTVTTLPRPGPGENVAAVGRAAKAAADIESETWTVAVAPDATETLDGDKVMTDPLAPLFRTTLRLYVADDVPLFVSVNVFRAE